MTSSTTPWIVSGMDVLNQPLEHHVRATLDTIIATPDHHAAFLNMLSLMEHLGSRKIMNSQNPVTMDQDILKHLAEEARHAFFFKRQAEKMAGHPLPAYTADNTLCISAARGYFARLDSLVSRHVGRQNAYPWVSLVIELRACWLYGLYQQALEQARLPISLRGLIAEEDQHLAEMYESCGSDVETLKILCRGETSLFNRLLHQLKNATAISIAA